MHTYKFDCGIVFKNRASQWKHHQITASLTGKYLQINCGLFTTWIAFNGVPGVWGVGDQIGGK
jgi:hypothetical protein